VRRRPRREHRHRLAASGGERGGAAHQPPLRPPPQPSPARGGRDGPARRKGGGCSSQRFGPKRACATTFFITVGSACWPRSSRCTHCPPPLLKPARTSPASTASSRWKWVKVWRTTPVSARHLAATGAAARASASSHGASRQ